MESATESAARSVSDLRAADGADGAGWAAAVDSALVARLHRPLRRPGLVRLDRARALLARHRSMAPDLTLADALSRRFPAAGASDDGPVVVAGRPVGTTAGLRDAALAELAGGSRREGGMFGDPTAEPVPIVRARRAEVAEVAEVVSTVPAARSAAHVGGRDGRGIEQAAVLDPVASALSGRAAVTGDTIRGVVSDGAAPAVPIATTPAGQTAAATPAGQTAAATPAGQAAAATPAGQAAAATPTGQAAPVRASGSGAPTEPVRPQALRGRAAAAAVSSGPVAPHGTGWPRAESAGPEDLWHASPARLDGPGSGLVAPSGVASSTPMPRTAAAAAPPRVRGSATGPEAVGPVRSGSIGPGSAVPGAAAPVVSPASGSTVGPPSGSPAAAAPAAPSAGSPVVAHRVPALAGDLTNAGPALRTRAATGVSATPLPPGSPIVVGPSGVAPSVLVVRPVGASLPVSLGTSPSGTSPLGSSPSGTSPLGSSPSGLLPPGLLPSPARGNAARTAVGDPSSSSVTAGGSRSAPLAAWSAGRPISAAPGSGALPAASAVAPLPAAAPLVRPAAPRRAAPGWADDADLGLSAQVHRLVVRELARSATPSAPGAGPGVPVAGRPPAPRPVPVVSAAPSPVRRAPAVVVRADRVAEPSRRNPVPVDVGRVADSVARRLARHRAVDGERRGMGR